MSQLRLVEPPDVANLSGLGLLFLLEVKKMHGRVRPLVLQLDGVVGEVVVEVLEHLSFLYITNFTCTGTGSRRVMEQGP